VISFPGGRATLIETAPDVSMAQILEATEAKLVVSSEIRQMQL
jgi:acetate CoA/acetoacetate CoA-transferase beta subunit